MVTSVYINKLGKEQHLQIHTPQQLCKERKFANTRLSNHTVKLIAGSLTIYKIQEKLKI